MRQRVQTLVLCVALIAIVSIVGLLWPQFTFALALRPREPSGLIGILTMPLLHGSLSHLLLNLSSFVLFAGLLMLQGIRNFLIATAVIVVLCGSALWIFGQPGAHIGASGLVFGYFGFLLVRGFYDRRFSSSLIALVVAFFYGGMIWGVLPNQPGVSWDGHLAGLVAGVVTSKLFTLRPGVTEPG